MAENRSSSCREAHAAPPVELPETVEDSRGFGCEVARVGRDGEARKAGIPTGPQSCVFGFALISMSR